MSHHQTARKAHRYAWIRFLPSGASIFLACGLGVAVAAAREGYTTFQFAHAGVTVSGTILQKTTYRLFRERWPSRFVAASYEYVDLHGNWHLGSSTEFPPVRPGDPVQITYLRLSPEVSRPESPTDWTASIGYSVIASIFFGISRYLAKVTPRRTKSPPSTPPRPRRSAPALRRKPGGRSARTTRP